MHLVNVGVLVFLLAALIFMHHSVNQIFASVRCANTVAALVMRRARLANTNSVPAEWYRIVEPECKPKALLVLLHGLFGHPIQFEHLRVRAEPNWAIYNPFIHRLGDDLFERVLDPIQRKLSAFIERHGESVPIILVGHSNGARMSGALEVWLRGVARNPVLVSAVAGPFLGTKVLNDIGGVCQMVEYICPEVIRELKYKSQMARKLVAAMSAPTSLCRKYWFYAGRQDLQVQPIESMTPKINQGERSIVLDGYEHASIAMAVYEHQLRTFRAFLREFND